MVAIEGWEKVSTLSASDLCRKMKEFGVRHIVYTDISRDGAMKGTNLDIYKQLLTISGLEIVASGGVSTMNDITSLRDMGVPAAIIGKALYTGALQLPEVLAEARGGQKA